MFTRHGILSQIGMRYRNNFALEYVLPSSLSKILSFVEAWLHTHTHTKIDWLKELISRESTIIILLLSYNENMNIEEPVARETSRNPQDWPLLWLLTIVERVAEMAFSCNRNGDNTNCHYRPSFSNSWKQIQWSIDKHLEWAPRVQSK